MKIAVLVMALTYVGFRVGSEILIAKARRQGDLAREQRLRELSVKLRIGVALVLVVVLVASLFL